MDDSARTSVRTNADHEIRRSSAQVMSFMGRPVGRRYYGKTRTAVASVARERIEILIDEARKMVKDNEDLSRRYVDLAQRISERTKVRIPSDLKRYLCKNCRIALVPGTNARIRLHARNSGIVLTCLSCGAVKRYPVTEKTRSKEPRSAMKPYIAQTLPSPKKNSSKERGSV